MKTAVEWFAERIQSDKIFNFETVLSKANKMFKEQIKNSYYTGHDNVKDNPDREAEQYYNETFKSE
jgi:predicted ABC-type ATPase